MSKDLNRTSEFQLFCGYYHLIIYKILYQNEVVFHQHTIEAKAEIACKYPGISVSKHPNNINFLKT